MTPLAKRACAPRSRCMARAISLGLVLVGCNDPWTFEGEEPIHELELAEDTPPSLVAGADALFAVDVRVELPVVRPTDTELEDLRTAAAPYRDLPYDRLPWVRQGDLGIQLDFVLHNRGDLPREVDFAVSGFNEFHGYQPTTAVIDGEIEAVSAQWQRSYALGPHARVARTIRQDEFAQMAVQLAALAVATESSRAAAANGADPGGAIDPSDSPEVVPGLIGLRAGLRASEPSDLLAEFTVRVRDHGERRADDGQPRLQASPKPLSPAVAGP